MRLLRGFTVLPVLVVVLGASGGARGAPGEPPRPPDEERLAAGQVLHGTDVEFRELRDRLASWDAARLLRLVDQLRAQRFASGGSLELLAPSGVPMRTDETEAAKAEAPALVAGLQGEASWRVRLHAWPLRLQERFAARWLGEFAPPRAGGVREVPAAYARMLLHASGEDAFLRAEPWGPLVLVDGQSAAWGHQAAVRYLQDFDVSGSMVMDQVEPIVGALQPGLRVGVHARRTDQGLTLAVDAEWSEVLRPIPTFQTSLAGGVAAPVTIELPELRILDVHDAVRLPRGGWLLAVAGRAFPEGDGPGTERPLVLLHAKVLAR